MSGHAGASPVDVILTFDADAPTYVPQGRTLGLDADTKHNLLQDSEDMAYDYDRLYLDSLLVLLENLDRTGNQN
jgi:hypothetical protein